MSRWYKDRAPPFGNRINVGDLPFYQADDGKWYDKQTNAACRVTTLGELLDEQEIQMSSPIEKRKAELQAMLKFDEKAADAASAVEKIYEPKYGGRDHSGYDTLMKYEVNGQRQDAFVNGARWQFNRDRHALEAANKRIQELEEKLFEYEGGGMSDKHIRGQTCEACCCEAPTKCPHPDCDGFVHQTVADEVEGDDGEWVWIHNYRCDKCDFTSYYDKDIHIEFQEPMEKK